jgi:hypothetical protein
MKLLREPLAGGVKTVVAFSVYVNYEENYHYFLEKQLG